jgi:hypothetical protein
MIVAIRTTRAHRHPLGRHGFLVAVVVGLAMAMLFYAVMTFVWNDMTNNNRTIERDASALQVKGRL